MKLDIIPTNPADKIERPKKNQFIGDHYTLEELQILFEKSKNDPEIKVPIVILTNKNTASASEILAAALKENNKATIVGETTYGKGVIQELITLSTGAGLKITTEEYYTPNRNKINKVGIQPDYEDKLPEEVKNLYSIEEQEDTQLKKAVELLK